MTFEQYIQGMTRRELVSHLLCPAIRSTPIPTADPREYFDVIFADPEFKPGTVFFFNSKKEDIIKMHKKLTKHIGSAPIGSMDMETSPNAINGGTNFGTAMSISAANSLEDAYTCGEACAKQGLECGICWSYGPVADLNINPKNPIINTRSWGDDADRAGDFVEAFVKGMQENGMIATAKHFPGDGVDDRDQHICTTANTLSKEEWMATFGKVWKRLIDGGLRSIMPGHIGLPAYEEDGKVVPATISKTLLTDLLRGEFGFDGLIVSDGMNMGGLAPYVTTEEGIIKMVQAGCDVLLFANFWADISYILDVLEKAIDDGDITIERVKESVYRIFKEKQRLGLLGEGDKMIYKPCDKADLERYDEVKKRIAKNALSIYKNELGVLPLDEKKIKKVISVDVTNSERPVNNLVDEVMRQKGIEVIKYGEYTENGLVREAQLPKADVIIVHFYYGSQWCTNHIAPNGVMIRCVYEYLFKTNMPVVMVCHGSPYIPFTFPYVKTILNTFSSADVDPNAIYDVLFGKTEAKGVTPVKLP